MARATRTEGVTPKSVSGSSACSSINQCVAIIPPDRAGPVTRLRIWSMLARTLEAFRCRLASRPIPVGREALRALLGWRGSPFDGPPLMLPARTAIKGQGNGEPHDLAVRSGRSRRTISSSSLACSICRDLKLRREARNSRTASRIAYSVERGIMRLPHGAALAII